MTGDVPFGKASSRICEEILPFALKCFILASIFQSGVVLHEQVLSNICLKAATPFTESSRVIYEKKTQVKGDPWN